MKEHNTSKGKLHHIFKDSTLVERETSHRRAVERIRKMQGNETHYLLRSEFSIIHGEEEAISADDKADLNAFELISPLPTELPNSNRYHILKDGTQYGSAPTHELAIFMIHQAWEQHENAVFIIIRGAEEFIRYPKRRVQHL